MTLHFSKRKICWIDQSLIISHENILIETSFLNKRFHELVNLAPRKTFYTEVIIKGGEIYAS